MRQASALACEGSMSHPKGERKTVVIVCSKAKELIGRIMSKGHDLPDLQTDGHVTLEMMIPGNKAGIIIGKGGETIKLLQVTN